MPYEFLTSLYRLLEIYSTLCRSYYVATRLPHTLQINRYLRITLHYYVNQFILVNNNIASFPLSQDENMSHNLCALIRIL